MNERFTSDLVFILIALIVAALLGFIIGYFIRRIRKSRFIALEAEKEQLRVKLDDSVRQLDATTKQLEANTRQLELCGRQLNEFMMKKEKVSAFDASAAKSVFGTRITENDLKIVEGIGEKIASLLNKRGIDTWYKLSQASPQEIKEILLTDGGPNYNIHEPGTWPAQALLAHEGKWNKLKEYQDQLTAGK